MTYIKTNCPTCGATAVWDSDLKQYVCTDSKNLEIDMMKEDLKYAKSWLDELCYIINDRSISVETVYIRNFIKNLENKYDL